MQTGEINESGVELKALARDRRGHSLAMDWRGAPAIEASSPLDRHDAAEADVIGQLVAFEAAICALILSAPDGDRLLRAWRDAEDRAFTQTSEPCGIDEERHERAKHACAMTLARFRRAIELQACR